MDGQNNGAFSPMPTYIGTKIIHAMPMTNYEFEKRRLAKLGEEAPADLMMGAIKEGYLVVYPDGYESWSPAAAFEEAYRLIDSMAGLGRLTFGDAIVLLKRGKKLRRAGWNGKGMYIVLQPGYPEGIGANANTARALGIPEGTIVKTRPYLAMMDAQGMLVTGWLASQTDMLAEDWELAE